jgi:Xaa-Pro aminopeptidase
MFVTVDDGSITTAARHAEAALDAIIANMRPGARTDALHANALGALAPHKLHPVLGGSVGHGIGLSLHEGPEFQASGDAILVEDGVYTLQVGAADANAGNVLISAIVRVAATGAEVLVGSKPRAR